MKTKTKNTIGMNSALGRISKAFPQVKQVQDAKHGLNINVTVADAKTGRKKDPNNCAMARACVRTKVADAAIIGIGYSWLIKNDVATRYKTSVAVAREVTSFDRHQDFAEGVDYKLSPPSPSNALGARPMRREGTPGNGKPLKRTIHHTANIRTQRH